ncbi:MAG: helix-turn-helix domain-containing protein [Bacillota bacterium]
MLGETIRRIRAEKGLSLRELADMTELTPSFLSQVERDLAEPSITSLRKIADALGVPIFYFLMDNEKPSPVVRKNERKALKMPESHLVYELLVPDLNRSMEVWMGRLAPGAVSCDTPLSHQGEECIVVLQGKMEVQLGEETHVLDEGDTIYYFGAVPHKLKSVGDQELVFLSTITPPLF